ncbi:3-isopropylmalate dehydratase large subunit [Ancylobacter mangrovi]|uniref:3-isopropylmalate dehydratase large subunit n=1 Tax=Ancylobacter mangrovi TaxID=2972472 RepID=UPI0021622C56|nr:3-isopropylmalate dehydratase large subunit [Ancylobacter mangrovi]MCS0503359.1 3-isopropylmalate dehydratase large subunit [Ancylobacter mangrovi]
MQKSYNIFEKILRGSIVVANEGEDLLFVDRHYLDETCFTCLERLEDERRPVRRPDLTFLTMDHTVPTRHGRFGLDDIPSQEIRDAIILSRRYAEQYGIELFDLNDRRRGIAHVMMPEQGISLPGTVVVCGDSHTATHGGVGALGIGVGLSEQTHILATQTFWFPRSPSMRVTIDGVLPVGVSAKDMTLFLIGKLGANGATGHMIEYAGSAVQGLSVEGRMTLCNMTVEAGGRAGLVAPDDVTFAWLKGRSRAPVGDDWERAVADWRALASDPDAHFDRELRLDAGSIEPMVTWGISPDDVVPVSGAVPHPGSAIDAAQRARMERALDYMHLAPGTAMTDIAIDRVFIGSCTNGRIEDLRAAAAVARRGHARVPAVVVPGSNTVRSQAEEEGLDRVFLEAGFEWRGAGCSMCVGMNGEQVPSGERCAATSNRNFAGRQGPGSRTHLMSPAMAAAAALNGRIVDARA